MPLLSARPSEITGQFPADSAAFADAEVTVISGGQPVYYYMISAE